MKRFLTLSATATLLICGSPLVHANLLLNGNLDRTHAVEIVPGFFLPQPDVWINQASRTISGPYFDDLSSEPWAGPAPTPVTTDGLLNLPFPEGYDGPDGGVFFKPFSGGGANGAANANVYQDVPGTPGLQYTLTGWAGAEANGLFDGKFAIDFLDGSNVQIGSAELDLQAAGLFTANGEPFNYKQYSVSGIAPANTAFVRARISMLNAVGNPAGGGQAFVVDDFSLDVPEPGTVAAGVFVTLAAIAAWRRRTAR